MENNTHFLFEILWYFICYEQFMPYIFETGCQPEVHLWLSHLFPRGATPSEIKTFQEKKTAWASSWKLPLMNSETKYYPI